MKSWLVIFVVAVVVGIVAPHLVRWLQPTPVWIDTHATQLHVGAWVADIPPPWRDIHELREPIPGAGVAIPGARTLLRMARNRQVDGQIDVFPMPRVTGEDGCRAFADVMEAQPGVWIIDAKASAIAGDPGCMIRLKIGESDGLLVTRTRPEGAVAVRCLGDDAMLDGSSGCDKIVYSLRIGS